MTINCPRGTADIFGEDIKIRDFIIETAKRQFQLFNYQEIITPAFEYTEVFNRSIGESTDIVKKEMYTFFDKKGRSITLRPEGTAAIVRAVIEHKLYNLNQLLKLFYIENMFRYERPQKGRMREFWQIGIEAIGSDNPLVDAEVIWLLNLIYDKLGFKNLELLINTVGCSKCRSNYIKVFKNYLKDKKNSLCQDCQERYDKNPLRIFDCKIQQCQQILKKSPVIFDYVCDECRSHFLKVKNYLSSAGINFIVKNELVRGFDYYTRTIFEIVSKDLESAQNALGGGGRYDNLIEQFGGPKTPAIGFAIGLDRTAVLLKQLNIPYESKIKAVKVYIITMDENFNEYGIKILKILRVLEINCDISFVIKSISSQIKLAEKNNYTHVIIIGESEFKSNIITIKNLKTFEQKSFNLISEKDKIKEFLK